MLRDLATATDDVLHGGLLRYVGYAVLVGVGVFVGMWYGIDALLGWWAGDEGTLPAVLDWLGALATLVLAWFLFPAVATAVLCLFLERVAALVERRHYPHLPPAPGVPVLASIVASVRFLVLVLGVNAVLLVVLVAAPPLYAVAWPVANGWLLGREYFELVALRRVSRAEAASLRRRHGTEMFVLGVAFALLFTVPVVNLLVPVWATAVLVHRSYHWLAAEPR
jgi:CysZ protein